MNIKPYTRTVVFYKDRSWADGVFDRLINQLPVGSIKHVCKTKAGNHHITLSDGSSISFRKAGEQSRAARCDKAIVQEGIDEETMRNVVMRTLTLPRVLIYDEDYNYKTYIC